MQQFAWIPFYHKSPHIWHPVLGVQGVKDMVSRFILPDLSNHIHFKLLDEMIYPFPNFKGSLVMDT